MPTEHPQQKPVLYKNKNVVPMAVFTCFFCTQIREIRLTRPLFVHLEFSIHHKILHKYSSVWE